MQALPNDSGIALSKTVTARLATTRRPRLRTRWRGSILVLIAGAIAVLALLAGCEGRSSGQVESLPEASRGISRADGAGSPAPAFDARFERLYLEGWHRASPDADGGRAPALARSDAVRTRVVNAFLRDYRPLEQSTRGELRAMLESGDAFREADAAMASLGLDGDDLVDVLAMHHAVHWAVVNRDRVRAEQLPAIREAIASSALMAELEAAGDAARQEAADRAAMLAAIRSREYVRLLQAGDADALRRYGDRVAVDFQARHGIDLREGDLDRLPPLGGGLASPGR